MRLDQKIRVLAALPVFQHLEAAALHVLAFGAQEKRLRAGDELFRKGEASEGGYVILEGRITVNARGAGLDGAEIHGAGALLGETALIAGTTRPGTATAVEPALVLEVLRSLVHRVLEEHPESAAVLQSIKALLI